MSPLAEVALVFLKLGAVAFGGPAAHVALMQREVVERRCWIDRQRFLDLVGATQLIPGPNSTELAISLGHVRAGWAGLAVAGIAFIVPAMLVVLALASVYARLGATPEVEWLFYGVKPVVIALVASALVDLGRSAVKGALTAVAGSAALFLAWLGVDEVMILLATGVVVMGIAAGTRPGGGLAAALAAVAMPLPSAASVGLGALFLSFLKIGSVIFGSGYVLLAFLRADFVVATGWLTDRQLLDAVAIGQLTPGPVFTTATFIGYLLGGMPGALVATVGIFLPAFVLVAATRPLIDRLRRSAAAGAFLDGVNVASLALMAAVGTCLGRDALVDATTVAVGIGALAALRLTRWNPALLVVAGSGAGLLTQIVGG